MPYCAKCGAQYDEKFDGCPLCANSAAAPSPAAARMQQPAIAAILGFGGALLLFAGTYLPALKLSAIIFNAEYTLLGGGPLMDQLNASPDSPIKGFLVLGLVFAVLAVATAALTFVKVWPGLWATGGLALATAGYGYFSLSSKIAEAVKEAGSSGSMLASAIQPGWGWAALFLASIAILAAAFMGTRAHN